MSENYKENYAKLFLIRVAVSGRSPNFIFATNRGQSFLFNVANSYNLSESEKIVDEAYKREEIKDIMSFLTEKRKSQNND